MLRAATVDDADAIAAVHVASWRVAYRGLLPDALLDGLSVADRARKWGAWLAAPPPRTGTVLVVDGATVLGFAATGPTPKTEDAGAGELYSLYLAPDAWGHGHGRRLHAGVLEQLRTDAFTHAGLWVLDTNERALRFYHREGWSETGETMVDRDLGGDVALCERRLHRAL